MSSRLRVGGVGGGAVVVSSLHEYVADSLKSLGEI